MLMVSLVSRYVTMEIVKFLQIFFMQSDLEVIALLCRCALEQGTTAAAEMLLCSCDAATAAMLGDTTAAAVLG